MLRQELEELRTERVDLASLQAEVEELRALSDGRAMAVESAAAAAEARADAAEAALAAAEVPPDLGLPLRADASCSFYY